MENIVTRDSRFYYTTWKDLDMENVIERREYDEKTNQYTAFVKKDELTSDMENIWILEHNGTFLKKYNDEYDILTNVPPKDGEGYVFQIPPVFTGFRDGKEHNLSYGELTHDWHKGQLLEEERYN